MANFLKTYMRKKPEGINEEFVKFFETFFAISLASEETVQDDDTTLDSAFPVDKDWEILQTMNIPHYTTWKNLFSRTRKPWPLIENAKDCSGPPMNFKWVDDNINHIKDISASQSEFVIGCDCSKYAYVECSGMTCSCASEWNMQHAYGNNGRLDPKFTGHIIIECNDKCDCSSSCPNRVVQNKQIQRFK